MNTSLTLTLNQLASLIGSFAFPDPDGDDSLVHGPGGPRVRTGVLAEIRRVTIAVIEWAERLGEQAMLSAQPDVQGSKGQAKGSAGATAAKPRSVKEGPDAGGPTDDDCGPQPTDAKGKGPPGSARVIIERPINDFVSDFTHGRPVRLPVPASPDANPWKLSVGQEGRHGLGLLVAAAQFQFAVEATKLDGLSRIFQAAANSLFEHGLRRLSNA